MADTKISDLAAVTGLVATDEFVLARSGDTKKITASDLSASLGTGELSYVEFTSDVSVTATTIGAADTVVTAGAITFDGSTVALIEFYAKQVETGTNGQILLELFEDGSAIGDLAFVGGSSGVSYDSVYAVRRMTPASGSRTYSVRAVRFTANGSIKAGTGGSGVSLPGFIRITGVI